MKGQAQVIAIFGPTASGKTSLAIQLAQRELAQQSLLEGGGGEIINADSRQIYKNLPVLTAMPSEEEFAQVPHHLFGIKSIEEKFSSAAYAEAAKKKGGRNSFPRENDYPLRWHRVLFENPA